jgi:hypothetical protein
MGIINSVKEGVTNPTPVSGGGLVKVIVSVVVFVGVALAALYFWGTVSNKNIPVVSQVVSPARVYIS